LLQFQIRLRVREIGGDLLDRGLIRDGSISASASPCFTGELKSTYNLLMRPETWLPTVTFTTGFNVPVAVTVGSPRHGPPPWIDIAPHRFCRV